MAASIAELFHRAVIAPLGAAWPFGIVAIAVLAFVIVDIAWLCRKRRVAARAAEVPSAAGSAQLTVDLRDRRPPPR